MRSRLPVVVLSFVLGFVSAAVVYADRHRGERGTVWPDEVPALSVTYPAGDAGRRRVRLVVWRVADERRILFDSKPPGGLAAGPGWRLEVGERVYFAAETD